MHEVGAMRANYTPTIQELRALVACAELGSASRAAEALSQALAALDDPAFGIDILAEILYSAIRALNSLVGRVDVEDVLDEIFSAFCIGK